MRVSVTLFCTFTDPDGSFRYILERPRSVFSTPRFSIVLPATPAYVSFPGGGVTPLYKVYRYVPPQRVWFLGRFGLKTGIDFDNYGLKSGRDFEGGNIYESLHIFLLST